MHAIQVCRTVELGGHLERCNSCGFERNASNSCRNHHCSKCQALAKVEWLEKRKTELLPMEYFHLVFTLPHELNALTLCNKSVVFDLLFKVVFQILEEFAADPKRGLEAKNFFYLNGEPVIHDHHSSRGKLSIPPRTNLTVYHFFT
jgi:hypothetical protein